MTVRVFSRSKQRAPRLSGRLAAVVALVVLLHALCAQPVLALWNTHYSTGLALWNSKTCSTPWNIYSTRLAQGGDLLGKAERIVKIVVDVMIGIAALVLALGFVANFVRGMVSTALGRPAALSDTWAAVIAIAICGGGALLTIPVANMFIGAVARYAGRPLDNQGLSELGQAASEVLSVAIGVTALLVAVGIAAGFLSGEISAAMGAPAMLSDVWFKIMAVVICLVVAVLATTISGMIVNAILPLILPLV